MYLDHFKLKELPFTITPNVEFFCHLKGHQEALNTILFSLRSREGFIKIIGEVGSGKTLLCRKILNTLDENYYTAYIPNPDLNPIELRRALARELGLKPQKLQDQHELLNAINQRLLTLHKQGKQIVFLIDEAQAMPAESLETLRLLTNLETETTKLMQIVLFSQPELDDKLNQPNLRQLKQRISFSYYLPFLSREELDAYIFHRLATAGNNYGSLFTKKALNILYDASKGIPRVVNILCHKALLAAYGKGDKKINHRIILSAISDTEAAINPANKILLVLIGGIVLLISLLIIIYFHQGIF